MVYREARRHGVHLPGYGREAYREVYTPPTHPREAYTTLSPKWLTILVSLGNLPVLTKSVKHHYSRFTVGYPFPDTRINHFLIRKGESGGQEQGFGQQ